MIDLACFLGALFRSLPASDHLGSTSSNEEFALFPFRRGIFHGDVDILPSTVAKLPPGPAETFFQAGVDTIVISGFDSEYVTRSYGSALQEEIDWNSTLPVAQTIASFLASQLEVAVPSVNGTYLESLINCLARDGQCEVIEDVLGFSQGYLTRQLQGRPLDLVTTTYSVLFPWRTLHR